VTTRVKQEDAVEIRFGGGRNSRASPDAIDPRECTDGENFILDPGNDEFRPREAYDLVGQAPNGSQINGFVTLKKTDDTVSLLVQAGVTVYEWDGSNFTSVGTVDADARIRGTIDSFWGLGDKVLITDLALKENLSSWDGTTYQEESLFQKDGSTAFAAFKAKYCVVQAERAIFGNLSDNGTLLPHVVTGTNRGDFATLIDTGFDDADRPASGLSEDAPWFIPMPQLRPINGMVFAYGRLAISQRNGAFEVLVGSTAQDFALEDLHKGSGAAGDEAVVATSNDIIYGAPGHIESLRATEQFGDVELDDPSFTIRDDIEDFDDWKLAYNQRNRRVYCFPVGQSNECHVLFTDFLNTPLSPWSKFTTNRSFAFNPTVVQACFDPADGLEYIFMGDASGNVYRLEGSGTTGDAGETDITAFRQSNLISAPVNAKVFNISGYVRHRRQLGNEAKLNFKFAGEHANDTNRTITFSAVTYDSLYGGSTPYGGSEYYGIAQQNRLIRRTFETPGFSNEFEVKVTVEGVNDFAVNAIGLHFDFSA
jgi:hypothetical protein